MKGMMGRYNLTLENLSFEFISQCKKQRTLERTLKVLRSGEEGHYPQLTQHCEDRLRALYPNSPVLALFDQVLQLPEEEREEIRAYTSVIRKKDELLTKESILRPIKTDSSIPFKQACELQKSQILDAMEKEAERQRATDPRTKQFVPWTYKNWQNLKIETEMVKLDLEDERKEDKIKAKKNKMSKNTKKKVGKYKSLEEKPGELSKGDLTPEEQEAMASAEKLKGNECYMAKEYAGAVRHYTTSIVLHPTAERYANRAAAYLKLEKYNEVVADCSEALNLDPWNVKALYRRGFSYTNLTRPEDAIEDFRQILEINPTNTAAVEVLSKLELERTNRERKKEVENQPSTSTNIHPISSRRMIIRELD